MPHCCGPPLSGRATISCRDRGRKAGHLHRLDVPDLHHHPGRLSGHLTALRPDAGRITGWTSARRTATWRCRATRRSFVAGASPWLCRSSALGNLDSVRATKFPRLLVAKVAPKVSAWVLVV